MKSARQTKNLVDPRGSHMPCGAGCHGIRPSHIRAVLFPLHKLAHKEEFHNRSVGEFEETVRIAVQ